jgi:hypothetical protein
MDKQSSQNPTPALSPTLTRLLFMEREVRLSRQDMGTIRHEIIALKALQLRQAKETQEVGLRVRYLEMFSLLLAILSIGVILWKGLA